MSVPVTIQPSKLEKISLFIKTVWTSLLFYIFCTIARYLPDPPEFQSILDTINELKQQHSQNKTSHLDLKLGKLSHRLAPITVIKLCTVLNQNAFITSVDASDNFLGNISAIAFSKTNFLTSLNLKYSQIDDVGAAYLAQNTVFKSLTLTMGHIGKTGIIALANNKHLREIAINSNRVNGDVAASIFSHNTTLKSLCLSGLGDIGAISLSKNKTIKSLKFEGNDISSAGYSALTANTALRSLNGCEPLQKKLESKKVLHAFFKNTTLIDCDVWTHYMNEEFTSKNFASRNKALLREQLEFYCVASILLAKKLPLELIDYIGSFFISENSRIPLLDKVTPPKYPCP